MFTGIIEELGVVMEAGPKLVVSASKVATDSSPGDSLAVNGVCLTVVERGGDGSLSFDLADETLRRSTLGALRPNDEVNLERPATLLTRLGGHLVQGHVDGVGRVAQLREADAGREMSVEVPAELVPYIVEKGSIAVDGVSLTVAQTAPPMFAVALIPFTLEATTLGRKRREDSVNLEVDMIAKYIKSFVGAASGSGGRRRTR